MPKTVHVTVDNGDTVVVHRDKPDPHDDPMYCVSEVITNGLDGLFRAIVDAAPGGQKHDD